MYERTFLAEENAAMQVVLLRVAIDTGSGGIHGPLFKNGQFEFIPIRDKRNRFGVNRETYGNTRGRHDNKFLAHYFPKVRRDKARSMWLHHDPEFKTFTYGDPTRPKAGLRRLEKDDLLVFYAGLQGWGFRCDPSLYIIGYFEVEKAVQARDHSWIELRKEFENNFHVRHRVVFDDQKDRLVLVKGNRKSKLLKKAARISILGMNKAAKPIHVLSPEMRKVFGDFNGHVSIHRSPPRFVFPEFVKKAARFVRSLT
jgi:Nucleotide modification associated domain 3